MAALVTASVGAVAVSASSSVSARTILELVPLFVAGVVRSVHEMHNVDVTNNP